MKMKNIFHPQRNLENSMLERGSERYPSHTSIKNKRNVDLQARDSDCVAQRDYLHEIFLGGSCKPTTWRRDIAIPHLEEHEISFYNPQVQDWVPELIKQENIAKENAEVMFFVIDKQTRSVASIIEVAYIAGTQRNLIAVIYELAGQVQVMGESIGNREFKDLENGRKCLQQILKYGKKKVFTDIRPALNDAIRMVQSIRNQHGSPLSKKRRISFDFSKNRNIIPSQNKKSRLWYIKKGWPNIFKTFPRLNISYKKKNKSSDSNIKSKLPLHHKNSKYSFDICLVSSEKTSLWEDDIAIPAFQNKGLKYVRCTTDDCQESLEIKIKEMKSCRVLLFVISENSRGMVEMTMAAHCIGMKENVVLCIQRLKNDVEIEGEKMLFQAVKDYNRGRVYLSDLASQNEVPVYEDIEDAVQCVVDKCVTRVPFRTSPK